MKITNNGNNNKIIGNATRHFALTVTFNGDNSTLIIGDNVEFKM